MPKRSLLTTQRTAYLSIGIVIAAVLLHSILLPLAKYQQVEPATTALRLLDIDQDTDGISDVNDREIR